jgi:hypothetical protein
MMLLFDKNFVLWKSCEKLRRTIDDPVKQIHTDRKVGTVDKRTVVTFDDGLNFAEILDPTSRSLYKSDTGRHASTDISPDGCSDRKVDSDIVALDTLRQRRRRESTARLIDHYRYLVAFMSSECLNHCAHLSGPD